MDGSGLEDGLDHYDFINAPQYVDFADLAQNDDPHADDFFETHREEDDFVISIESISPTVHLLANNTDQNVLDTNESQVNQAVSQAGMEDVKVVYLASPSAGAQNLKRPMGGNNASLDNTYNRVSVYYTPEGELGENEEEVDKENFAPSPEYFLPLGGEGKKGRKSTLKNSPSTFLGIPEGKNPGNASGEKAKPGRKSEKDKDTSQSSVVAQFEKLSILSTDEEDLEVEENFYSPTNTSITTDEELVNTLLKTPGAYNPKPGQYSVISAQKRDFFEGLSIESPAVVESVDVKTQQIVNAEDGPEFVPLVPQTLEFEELAANEEESRKQSFIVKPHTGQEMVWGQEETETIPEANQDADKVTVGALEGTEEIAIKNDDIAQMVEEAEEIAINSEDIAQMAEEAEEAETTLTSSIDPFESEELVGGGQVQEFMAAVEASSLGSLKNRRSSSCNDLHKLHESVKKTLIPRMGLTIPHSPDACKRTASKCRSALKTGESGLAGNVAGSSMKSGIPLQKANVKSSAMPTIPYKGAVGRQPREPLKATHYVSLAEAITKYHKNTPDRFRTLPRGRVPIKRSSSVGAKPDKRAQSPSPPRSPQGDKTRSRTNSVCTQGSNASGSSQIKPSLYGRVANQQKKATIPQPFNLSSARPTKTVADAKSEATDFKFKARPVPSKLLQGGPAGIKDRPQAKVTQATAPHFASDDRIRERKEKKAQSATQSPTGAGSRPGTAQSNQSRGGGRVNRNMSALSRIPVPDSVKPCTVMKPFSFDQRNAEALRRKEEKLKQELEEAKKVREFHAHPLPTFHQKLPKKKPIPVTNVAPFHLKSDERGEAYQEALKQKHEEEERHLKMMATFYANPPVVLHKPAFEPEHPARPPLEPLDFQLNTEKRAAEREQYDSYLRQKEAEEEQRRQEEQARLEEAQKQEEIERRRQIVHKAQPFRHPKQFQPKASGKLLTVPQSPAFNPLPSQRRITPTKKSDLQ